jgi:cholestenol Delta-isomerase
MASTNASLGDILHPYYPLTADLPGYVPNALTTLQILNVFVATTLVILGSTHLVIRWTGARLSRGEEATAMWFVLCGFIHLFLEGAVPHPIPHFSLSFDEDF